MRRLISLAVCIGLLSLVPLGALASPMGYTFRMGMTSDTPDTLDAWTWTSNGRNVIWNVYEPLVTFRDTSLTLEPALAESWEISEDGLVYTFHIREGVTFIDGAPLNAAAVVTSFERCLGINLGPSQYLSLLDTIVAVDEYTVRMTLTSSSGGFLNSLYTVLIVSPQALEENKTSDDPWAKAFFNTNPVGTGPFKLDEWRVGEYIHMVRNEDYWRGWQENQISDIYIMQVEEASTQRLMLEQGDLHIAPRVTADDAVALASNPDIVVENLKSLVTIQLMLNTAQGPLSNLLVRRALAYAFDFEAYQTLRQGFATPLNSPFIADFTDGPIEGLREYPYDLDMARTLLERAGVEPGEITLKLGTIAGLTEWMQMAEVLQDGLRQLGIALEIRELPWPTILELQSDVNSENWDIIPYMAASSDGTASAVGKLVFHSSGIGYRNLSLYSSMVVDDLINQGMASADAQERIEIETLLARVVMEDCPAIIVAQRTFPLVHRAALTQVEWFILENHIYSFHEFVVDPGSI